MNQSLVSIIVPIYNTAEYIGECIQSILSQSYKNIELILVNDVSTDGSGEICKKYHHLPNVIYIRQDNCGANAARKCGMKEAHGEWIMFIDSDDWIYVDALERMMSKSEGADILVASSQRNNLQAEPDVVGRDEYLRRMYRREFSCVITPKIFRRTLFDKDTFNIPREFVWFEDFLINIKLAISNTRPIHVCQSIVYFYRNNPSSVSHIFDYSMDYFLQLSDFADGIVEGKLSKEEQIESSAIMRLHFYKLLLGFFHYKINVSHPYVQTTKQRLLEAGRYKLSDRLLLNHPSKTIYIISRIIVRFEYPPLLLGDYKRVRDVLHDYFCIIKRQLS